MRLVSFALPVLLAAACGGDGDFNPGAGDDLGTGTATLQVRGTAHAQPVFPNASAGADFLTSFEVAVEKAGVRIITGTVTITSASGAVPLTLDTRNGGIWIGQQNGYNQVYQLDVASGTDSVDGVRVDGPDAHSFTAPLPGATVNATMPLAIAWKRGDTADRAIVKTKETNDTDISDTGSYSLPAGSLKSKPDAAESEELRLTRLSVVVPAGATAGSTWTVEVRNQIDLVVAPTGL